MTTLWQDIRYALRQLRRSPGFAITAVLTIALGIGANTAIFTLTHSILLRKLPVTDPKSLYRIGDDDSCCMSGGMPGGQSYTFFSTEEYRHLQANLPEFEELAAVISNYGNGPGLVRKAGSNDAAEQVRSAYVSGNYFQLFQLQPRLGRLLTNADDHEGAPSVGVMSYATWVNQFHSDPAVVGTTLLFEAHPVTIVGVAPQSFYGDRISDRPANFYLPIAVEPLISPKSYSKNPDVRWAYVIGRIRPGVSLALLQGKVNAALRNYVTTRPEYSTAEAQRELPKVHATLVSAATGIEQLQAEVGQGIRILMGLSAVVLLIACANVANLLLARATARRAETAVRVAIGATRSRILRQSLTESMLLALTGSALGIAVAFFGARAMLLLAFPKATGMPVSVSPSLPVLAFTLGVAIFTSALFGWAPAWMSGRSRPADALRGTGRSAGSHSAVPQRFFVILQISMSVVLIAVAGLLTRSLSNLQNQNFGLGTDNRLVLNLNPAGTGSTQAQMLVLMHKLQQQIDALPGTLATGFISYSPLSGDRWGNRVLVDGKPDPGATADTFAAWERVTPGFFHVVAQPVLRGRDFTAEDRENTPQVVVVNQRFVQKFFPSSDPLGQRIFLGTGKYQTRYTIVGIVADAKYSDIGRVTQPMYFRSITQLNPAADPGDMGEQRSIEPRSMMIHTAGPQAGYDQLVRKAVQDVDPSIAITGLHGFDSQIADQLNDQRMVARLTAAFGLLALVLASVGLYGVTAYSVVRRVPEIGLRMALGSNRRDVVALILTGSMTQTLIGLAVGLPAALLAGHFLQSQLFGIRGFDAATLAGACFVLVLAALIASAVPARRASAVEPMQALRAE